MALDDALDPAPDGQHAVDVEALLGAQRRSPDEAAGRVGAEHVDGLAQHAGRRRWSRGSPRPRAGDPSDRLHRVDLGGVDHVRRAQLPREREAAGRTSTAMIGEQPTMAAAMTADSPTPPAPKIAIDELGSGRRMFMTPPAPVWIPQPNGATSSKGTSSGIVTTLRSGMTAPVAKLDWPKKCECTGSPSREIAVLPSARVARKLRSKNSVQWKGGPGAHPAAAARRVGRGHVVAHLHARDRRADLLDDARALMAEDDRHRRRERAVADEQVGVADARGDDPHAAPRRPAGSRARRSRGRTGRRRARRRRR